MKTKPSISKIDKENISLTNAPEIIKAKHKNSTKRLELLNTEEEFQPYLYLYAAMTQPHLVSIIRSFCSPEEITNLHQTITSWKQARAILEQLTQQEPGISDNTATYDIAPNQKIVDLQNNVLFQRTFSATPFEIKMVDIDTLVATQRHVYLDYVKEIESKISEQPTIDELIDICLPINPVTPLPKVTPTGPGTWLFSSPSPDLRYIGGHLKEQLTPDDLQFTQVSGVPTHVITLFVGYGSNPINVIHANNRLILNNGFHRVYALRNKGITKIPVVVQKVSNPELEFPPEKLGLTRKYLLHDPRPILVKDFFANGLTKVLKRKKMITTVQVTAQGGALTFEV